MNDKLFVGILAALLIWAIALMIRGAFMRGKLEKLEALANQLEIDILKEKYPYEYTAAMERLHG